MLTMNFFFKIISTCFFCISCCFFQLNAQNSMSQLNMTPAEWQILLETIAEAKQKKRYARRPPMRRPVYYPPANTNTNANIVFEQKITRQIEEVEKVLDQINQQLQELKAQKSTPIPPPTSTPTVTQSSSDLKAQMQLEQLHKELMEELALLNGKIEALEPNQPTVVTLPSPTASDSLNDNSETLTEMLDLITQIKEKIDSFEQADELSAQSQAANQELQFHIDSLKNKIVELQQNQLDTTTNVNAKDMESSHPHYTHYETILDKLLNLETQLDSLRQVPPEVIIKEVPKIVRIDSEYDEIKAAIAGKSKGTVFFATASSKLSETARTTLKGISHWLLQYDRIDVLVTGFASNKGNPVYNETLSQNRTEAVKKYLMEQGIHADRIFTEYHGIDYEPTDPQQAQRADILMIVRKKQ